MATMNISLPDQMKAWVEAQVATGQYANASDFVRDLLRDHYQRHEKLERLQEMIRAGEESGISKRSIDDIIADAKQRAKDKGLI